MCCMRLRNLKLARNRVELADLTRGMRKKKNTHWKNVSEVHKGWAQKNKSGRKELFFSQPQPRPNPQLLAASSERE